MITKLQRVQIKELIQIRIYQAWPIWWPEWALRKIREKWTVPLAEKLTHEIMRVLLNGDTSAPLTKETIKMYKEARDVQNSNS